MTYSPGITDPTLTIAPPRSSELSHAEQLQGAAETILRVSGIEHPIAAEMASPAIVERAQGYVNSLVNDSDYMQRLTYTSWAASTDPNAAGDKLEEAYAVQQGPHTDNAEASTAEALAFGDAAIDYANRRKAGELSDEEKALELAMAKLYPKGIASIEENRWNKMLRTYPAASIAQHEAASGKLVLDSDEAFERRVAEITALQAGLKQ